jgi:WD40 repeat protein
VLIAAGELGLPELAAAGRRLLTGAYLEPRWSSGSGSGRALLRAVDGHPGSVQHLAPTPDGTGVVTVSTWAEVMDDGSGEEYDDPPRLWDLRTWAVVQSFEELVEDRPNRVAVTPDGRYAVFRAGYRGAYLIWDLPNGRLVTRQDRPGAGIQLLDLPDGGRLAALAPTYRNGGLVLWPADEVPDALRAAGDDFSVLAVAGRIGVAARYRKPDATPLQVWDLTTGRVTAELAGSSAGHVAVDPSGRRALGTTAGGIGVWDVASGELTATVDVRAGELRDCVVTGEYGVFANWYRNRLVVVRLADGRHHEIGGLDATPDVLVAHAVPGQVLTARAGGFRVWSVAAAGTDGAGNRSRVTFAALFDGDRKAVTVSYDDVVVWDLATGTPLHRIEPGGHLGGFALAPDGRQAAVCRHGWVERWDLTSGAAAGRYFGNASPGSPVAFRPDGRALVRSGDRDLRLLDPAEPLPQSPGYPDAVRHLLVPPDGRTALVVAGWDVFELDFATATFAEHYAAPSIRYPRYRQGQYLAAVALSPDGGWVFVAIGDRVDIWDRESRRRVDGYDHGAPVAALSVSADGSLLVAGGGTAVSVWDLRTRQRLARAELAGEVTAVATAIRGAAIVVGGVGGAVHCLRLAAGEGGEHRPVRFRVRRQTDPGEDVYVVGESPELGAWDPNRAVRMTWTPGHIWQATVAAPPDGLGRYKYLVRRGAAGPEWEPGPDRTTAAGHGGDGVAPDGWSDAPAFGWSKDMPRSGGPKH